MAFWSKLKQKFTTETPIVDPIISTDKKPKVVADKKQAKQKLKKEKVERTLANASLSFSKDIKNLSKKYKKINDDFFDELEEILIKTDMGMTMVLKISRALQKKVTEKTSVEQLKEMLVDEIGNLYDEGKKDNKLNFVENRLNIFMLVGVNGVGKTTSLSKVANFYALQGKKVLIAAADTFRAGAVEQLEQWVNLRIKNVDLIKPTKPNQDPASVVFDAIKQATDQKYDLLLIDTAGRLQNKVNLMKELEKMHDIVHKFDKKAPHEVLMVIDATTGQNGVIQSQAFAEVTNISGIILTKMDGTSKGGIALAIKEQLDIPVKLMGVGETVDDLVPFDLEQYIYGLVSGFMEEQDQ